MSNQLAWVRWWARPWETPACDWEVLRPYIASTDLCRSRHERVSTALAITPCLPPSPSPALLHLVQASPPQRDRMLTLIGSVCQPVRDHLLEEDEYLWCQRLAKALPADSRVLNTDDPLQYLRAWVEPAVWQRLRLGFANKRVVDLERYSNLPDRHGRLDTLWRAVIWRATAITNDHAWP